MFSLILRLIHRIISPLVIHLSDKREVYGLTIVHMASASPGELLFDKIENALSLIAKYDMAKIRRIKRDVKFIGVAPIASTGGEYWDHLGAIMLNSDNVLRQTSEAIAMIIVHEATHARLHRHGIRYSRGRERAERACVKAEISFIRKIPGTDHLIAGALRKLETRYWEKRR